MLNQYRCLHIASIGILVSRHLIMPKTKHNLFQLVNHSSSKTMIEYLKVATIIDKSNWIIQLKPHEIVLIGDKEF